jgi:hypothetical protein
VFELFLAGSMHDCKLKKSRVKQHSESGEEVKKKDMLTNRVMFKWDIENLGFHKALLTSRYDFPEAEVPSST